MSEFPSRIIQSLNLITGGLKIEVSRISAQYRPKIIQRCILYGLEILMPQEVNASCILQDHTRQRMVDNLLKYQMRMNDRIDSAHLEGNDSAEIKAKCVSREVQAKKYLDESLTTINSPEIKTAIESSFVEVEAVERHIHSKSGKLSFDEVEKYRNLVNAISYCAVTIAMLGQQSGLLERLQPFVPEELSWQGIYKKYTWVFGNQPSDTANNVERTTMIMHNLCMAGQIDDDWYGRHIDRALGIDSLASVAMEEKHQNEQQAKEFLDDIKNAYLEKAGSLGLNSLGITVFDIMQNKSQKAASFLIHNARFSQSQLLRDWITGEVIQKMGMRELAFVEGQLDKRSNAG